MVRNSIIFTYTAQIYAAIISIIFIPIYIARVGVEEFGLIGFLLLLQNVLQLLDAGIGGSLSRQASITKQSAIAYKIFLKKFFVITIIFIILSIILFLFGLTNKSYIAAKWLTSSLDTNVLNVSIISIFMILSARYVSGPFRSGLIGIEKHIFLGIVNVIIASLKFPGGLLVLVIQDNSIVSYFIYQAIIACFELLLLSVYFTYSSRQILAMNNARRDSNNITTSYKALLLFSGQLSLLSIAWVVVSQIDKLALSKFLSLKEFGYYSLAVSVSAVIMMFSVPLSQILMSRLTVLISNDKRNEYLDLYLYSITILTVIIAPLGIFLYIFSQEIIMVWTGDKAISLHSSFYTKWLVIGNVFSVLMTFVFLLQYSAGKLKTHTLVYLLYSLILVPVSIYIAYNYKGQGSVLFWFVHNIFIFTVWGGFVHRKYIDGFNTFFWLYILLPVFIISTAYMYTASLAVDFSQAGRTYTAAVLFIIGTSDVLLVLLYFRLFKNRYKNRIKGLAMSSCFNAVEAGT